MRLDNSVAYAMTAIFVVAMMVVGAELLHAANIALARGDRGLLDLANVLGERYGKSWATIFLVGFWAASFSSLVGVWNGVSLMFADFVAQLTRPTGCDAAEPPGLHSPQARAYLLWLTFPPMSLLFLDRPFLLIVGYGALGALFMPFLAVTLLLLMNSSQLERRWRNGWFSNFLLGATCLLFVTLGAHELVRTLRPLLPG